MLGTGYITAGFAWKPEAQVDVKHVELLISKAEDIYQDHFDSNDVTVQSLKCSTYNLEQWNSDGGSFCVCPSLEPGVYQFVFRVDNGEEKELKISDYYDRTFLGNGRAVNYIELMTDQAILANSKKHLTRSYGDSAKVNSTSGEKCQTGRKSNSNGSDSQHDPNRRSCTLL